MFQNQYELVTTETSAEGGGDVWGEGGNDYSVVENTIDGNFKRNRTMYKVGKLLFAETSCGDFQVLLFHHLYSRPLVENLYRRILLRRINRSYAK